MTNGPTTSRMPSPRVGRGAIGVVSRGGRYLVIRRADGLLKGGCWCFPGGHLERGETSRQAVIRELAEELGISVEPVERLGAVRVDTSYVLAVWRVRHVGGAIRPAKEEIAEVRWATSEELRALEPNVPSNDRVLAMLDSIADSAPGR